MAEGLFSTGLSDPQAAGATVVAPVQGIDYGPTLGAISDIGKLWDKNQKDKRKEEAEARKSSTVGTFYEEHDKLERLKQAGSIGDKEYSIRSQTLVRHYGATFPEYQEDITKAATALKGFGGLGDVQDNTQYLKTEERNRVSEAQKMGFDVSMNDSPEYRQAALRQHSEVIRVMKESEERRKLREEARTEDKFERERGDWLAKKQASEDVQKIGASGLQTLHALGQQLEIESKKPGADIAAITARWDSHMANWKANISASSKEFGEVSAGWNAVINNFDTMFRDRLTNKIPSEAARNTAQIYIDVASAGFLKDPVVADGFARLKYAPNAMDALLRFTKDDAVIRKMFGVITQGKGISDLTNKEEAQAQLKAYNELSSRKDITPEEKVLVRGRITNSLLQGLGHSMITGADPAAVDSAIRLITNPGFVEDLNSKTISQPAYDAAKQAVAALYNAPVTTQLTNKFDEPMSIFGNRTALEMFDIKVDANGAQLVPKLAYFASPDMVFGMNSLNKSAIALNNLIVANAHLSGTTDYPKYWEDNKQHLFPAIFGDPAKLKVGDVINGKKFLGGPYKNPDNWEDVANRSSEGVIGGKPTTKSNVSVGRLENK